MNKKQDIGSCITKVLDYIGIVYVLVNAISGAARRKFNRVENAVLLLGIFAIGVQGSLKQIGLKM